MYSHYTINNLNILNGWHLLQNSFSEHSVDILKDPKFTGFAVGNFHLFYFHVVRILFVIFIHCNRHTLW